MRWFFHPIILPPHHPIIFSDPYWSMTMAKKIEQQSTGETPVAREAATAGADRMVRLAVPAVWDGEKSGYRPHCPELRLSQRQARALAAIAAGLKVDGAGAVAWMLEQAAEQIGS